MNFFLQQSELRDLYDKVAENRGFIQYLIEFPSR